METREYAKCYIAFLDMLGFKNLVKSSKCEDICTIFDNVRKPLSAMYFHGEAVIPQSTARALRIKIMSDSICFYIDASLHNALFTLIMSCIIFQVNLFAFPTPVLLRGAIVHGDIYAKGDVTFGPGLTQAYMMEEHNARYPRIILTNEVLDYARREAKTSESILNDWIFRDIDAFYTLNCLKMFLYLNENREENICKDFLQNIKQVLDTTTDESIREKYLYLEKVQKEHCFVKDDSHA